MASVKGTELTNIDATPTVKISSEVAGGKLRVFHGTYEAASLASGSDISIARIPTNATIHDVIIKCDALGGSSTLKIGTAADDDLFIAATGTWNVAGQTQSILAGSSTGAPIATITGVGHRTTAVTDVIITTGGATISGSIKCLVIYSVE
jgi:hypothetical protein|tara:strand:- start:1567 stop:2016 length:450 start_codon:yes stop_codon:yes gene_type:complete